MPASMRFVASLLFIAALAACHDKPPPSAIKPPVNVSVMVATPTEIAVSHQLPGRLQAYREAEVRARVGGIVTARLYREGQEVHKGSRLFQIDPAPLRVAFEIADAALAQAVATETLAADKLQRYSALVDRQAVSRREHTEALAEHRLARAAVAAARAVRKRTSLELGYANVTAPIAGRARRAMVTEGALVGIDTATPLTTIEQIDPIYVNFSQPAGEVARMQRAIRNGTLHGLSSADIDVKLILPDGSPYPYSGKLIFSDMAIDPATDTIAMRAVLPNPKRQLLPGGYVQIRLTQAHNTTAILIPQHALLRTPHAATVLVVNAEQRLEAVTVLADTMSGGLWIVRDGLSGGERVVVADTAVLKAGAKVVARLAATPTNNSATGAGI